MGQLWVVIDEWQALIASALVVVAVIIFAFAALRRAPPAPPPVDPAAEEALRQQRLRVTEEVIETRVQAAVAQVGAQLAAIGARVAALERAGADAFEPLRAQVRALMEAGDRQLAEGKERLAALESTARSTSEQGTVPAWGEIRAQLADLRGRLETLERAAAPAAATTPPAPAAGAGTAESATKRSARLSGAQARAASEAYWQIEALADSVNQLSGRLAAYQAAELVPAMQDELRRTLLPARDSIRTAVAALGPDLVAAFAGVEQHLDRIHDLPAPAPTALVRQELEALAGDLRKLIAGLEDLALAHDSVTQATPAADR